MGRRSIPKGRIKLRDLSRFVDEVANLIPTVASRGSVAPRSRTRAACM